MVPNVAKTGTSFKGAAQYYLHDKREAGEVERFTSDRVAWTHTRNLATDDPELAWKVMAATAMDQERLKQQAGVKATGRKSTASVYAFSIAWHPEEQGRLSQAEMLQAAEDAIRAIGAEDRQALIVAHRDEPHPHVHVILNRVSPTDGRMLTTSNDRLKLSEWALTYREGRGEERTYCPERRKNVAARKRGEMVRARSPVPRAMVDQFRNATAANDNRDDHRAAMKELDRRKTEAGRLKAAGAAMKDRHRAEWKQLGADHRARKAAIDTQTKAAKDAAIAAVKGRYRPLWRALFQDQAAARSAFQSREKSLFGRLQNALDATVHRHVGTENVRGVLSAFLNNLVSRPTRQQSLEKIQARAVQALGADQNRAIRGAIAPVSKNQKELFRQATRVYQSARSALIERQAADKTALRMEWQQLSEARRNSFEGLRREREARSGMSAPAESSERETLRAETKSRFNQASQTRGRGLRLRQRRRE